MHHQKWKCPKGENINYNTGEIRVSGGFWSRIFDVQNKKYTAVTCDQCSYTEFYKTASSTMGNIFDFLTG